MVYFSRFLTIFTTLIYHSSPYEFNFILIVNRKLMQTMKIQFLILSILLVFSSSKIYAQGEDCADAIPIPYTSLSCGTYNNVGYSQDNAQVNFNPLGLTCNGTDRDIWFSFTTSATPFEVTLTVTGIADGAIGPMNMPRITVVRGNCTVLEAMACSEAPIGINTTSLTIPASNFIPNFTYYVLISDWSDTAGSNEGAFEFCLEEYVAPVNNNIENGEIYTSCSGTLFDTGGPDNDYMSGENITAQICPNDPFQCIIVEMIEVDIESGFDGLSITPSGGTNSDPCVNINSGGNFDGFATGTGSAFTTLYFDNCIDITFTSDGSVENGGFELNWSCSAAPCEIPNDIFEPSQPEGAAEVSGCASGAGTDEIIFFPNPPPGQVTFDVNNTCWFGTGDEVFYYYYFEAQSDGNFEFLIQNPPSAQGQFIDVDFLVWGPLNGSNPDDFCNGVLDTPIRCSYAGGEVDDVTGLANINPEDGSPVTDNNDDNPSDDFAPGIPVLEGEVYLVLLNFWSVGAFEDGLSIDFSGSTSGLFESESSGPLTSNLQDTSICVGQAVQLDVTGADISIEWSPATGLNCTDCSNPIAGPTETTTYQVIGEGICGTDTIEITVEVFDLSDIPDVSICDGESAELEVNSNSSDAIWSWSPTDSLSCTDCPNPTATPTTTTTYTVTMTTPECTLTGEVTVNVSAGQAANYVIIPDATICSGVSIPLGGVADPDATYVWTPDGSLDLTDPANPIASPSMTTTYSLEVTNTISGCTSTDQVTINVIDPFTPTITGSLEVCTNTDLSTDTYDSYQWLPTGETTQTINVSTAGDYTVIVTDANGCTGSNTVTVSAGNAPMPTILGTGDVTCSGTTNGYINLDVTGGTSPYNYEWTNNVSQGSSATNLDVGTYTATITDAGGCTAEISATVNQTSSIVLTVDHDTICPGDLIQLSATGGVGTYTWTPSTGLDLTDNANPTANPTETTTYYASYQSVLENLVVNGGFEQGNTGFLSDYSLGDGGTFGDLSDEAEYGIYTSPSLGHNNFVVCGDHTSGTGEMMVVNGASFAGQNVWCQNVSVDPATDYNFSAWLTSVVSDNPAILQFTINGDLIGGNLDLTSNTCDWDQFNAQWNSGTQTNAQICIINLNTAVGGNDFALDDIEFGPVCSLEDSVTVYVSSPIIEIIDTNDDFCGSCQGSLVTSVSGGFGPYTYAWDDTNSQTGSIAGGLCGNASYTVTVTDAYGCTAVISQFVQDLGSIPVEIEGDLTYCEGENPTITAGPIAFDTYLWNSNETTASIEVPAPGEYSVIVTSGSCTGSDTITVIELSNPIPTIIGANEACEGDTVSLSLGEVYDSYTWSGGLGNAPTATVTSSGTYSVTIVDVNGCEGSTSIDIILGNLPVEITGDTELCLGENTTLSANTQGAVFWYENGVQINTMANANLDVSPTSAGTYTYVAEAISNTCTNTDTIVVTVADTPVLTASGDEICPGENATITASSSLGDILWTPQGKFADPTAGTQTVSPNATSVYTVVADNNGCTASQDVTVVVTNGPEYDVIDDATICLGESITIGTVTASGTTYSWTPSDGTITDPNIGTPEVTPTTTTTYTLNANNGNCTAIDDVTITVLAPQVTADDITVCSNETAVFTAVGNGSDGVYTWLDWEGNVVGTDATFVTSSSETTSYTVTYESGGCFASTVVNLNINQGASVAINANPSTEILAGQEVTLTATGIPSGSDYTWTASTGVDVSGNDVVTVIPQETTTYTVTGTTADGCPFTASITIVVDYIELEIPNVFTPNADEMNDSFYPIFNDFAIDLVEFKVFDRWGELVHEDINSRWDGTYRGKELPSDIYVWFVKVRYGDGTEEIKKGDVALLR